MDKSEVTEKDIVRLHDRLKKEAAEGGYNLNLDEKFTKDLVKGLLTNEKRYGYWACPCRLASGKKEEDLDIICPCDYRDADLLEHGMCYCALYVSEAVVKGEKVLSGSIPERRLPPGKRKGAEADGPRQEVTSLSLPVWRCKVCGYLCARENPPEICPICKAKKDRFEKFL
jgi:ferredoxin-thioredoxin reductase catalytic subunit